MKTILSFLTFVSTFCSTAFAQPSKSVIVVEVKFREVHLPTYLN